MLVPQEARGRTLRRQGSLGANLGELRRQLGSPSTVDDGNRQRLLDLKRRLARVRALGDEYARVDFSPMAAAATDCRLLSR